jgi:hypothetical protein
MNTDDLSFLSWIPQDPGEKRGQRRTLWLRRPMVLLSRERANPVGEAVAAFSPWSLMLPQRARVVELLSCQLPRPSILAIEQC